MLTVDLQLAQPASEGAWIEGLVMGLAYLLGGLLPMIPYFCTHRTTHALFASAGMTAVHNPLHLPLLPSPSTFRPFRSSFVAINPQS